MFWLGLYQNTFEPFLSVVIYSVYRLGLLILTIQFFNTGKSFAKVKSPAVINVVCEVLALHKPQRQKMNLLCMSLLNEGHYITKTWTLCLKKKTEEKAPTALAYS